MKKTLVKGCIFNVASKGVGLVTPSKVDDEPLLVKGKLTVAKPSTVLSKL